MNHHVRHCALVDLERVGLNVFVGPYHARDRHDRHVLGDENPAPFCTNIGSDASVAGALHLRNGRHEEFRHADAIEEHLAHCDHPAFRLSGHACTPVRSPTLKNHAINMNAPAGCIPATLLFSSMNETSRKCTEAGT